MYQKWTAEEVEFLNNRYGKESTTKIAQELGRPKANVYAKARSLNLNGRTDRWKAQDVTFLQENYLVLGAKETARQLGRTLQSVHSKIREVGGGKPPTGPRNDWNTEDTEYLRENYSKLTWEEMGQHLDRTERSIFGKAQVLGLKRYVDPYEFFETWTENSAYIIGFFAADGWASKRGPKSIRIGFSQKEPDILYTLRDTIGIGRVYSKNDGMHRYYIQSVRAYERLCKIFGQDVCRKTHTLQWPNVPDEYARHFVRGAMDGDGSLMKRRDNLWEIAYTTSSQDFIEGFTDNVFRLTGISLNVGLNKLNAYHARCTGIKAVCLADWLYRDYSIFMERKEWIAREMYNTLGGQAYESSITPKMREMFPHILKTYSIVG